MLDLFSRLQPSFQLCPGVFILREFAGPVEQQLLCDMETILAAAPLRHMHTPGGRRLSVAMTNCGQLGWVSDAQGYRYAAFDPQTGVSWPSIPLSFLELAQQAAQAANFSEFMPDSCLINCYQPGAKMTMHQDKDESDLSAPIVSVSLGLPATFKMGGGQRTGPVHKVMLSHGDVMVWGNEARLAYHGVLPLKEGVHPLVGRRRINLTFRKAR
ncbi:DNA oxidative demethylase AlkB [Candidatus Odyssella thessalonicensis]|uniref:DNA oxidative demethylase AlkB n=1 Tax=Candidatus Odyssella thessalonicensis TaxID=84647 RepID=UPI000225A94C|nr:DNA oxidative demethylase AlkB [Candidatus Odyssella thessalonicensis]